MTTQDRNRRKRLNDAARQALLIALGTTLAFGLGYLMECHRFF